MEGLEEITPACSGPYWAVGEEFTAGPFIASCAGLETVPDRTDLVSEREADEIARKRLAAAGSQRYGNGRRSEL